MFGMFLKQKKLQQRNHEALARGYYAAALAQSRKPVFYTQYGVPDTMEGRFDLLLLHLFLIFHSMMEHPDYKSLSQALFDETFRSMDQSLREIGIGDMGVPKRMRKLMKDFNGRMHAYEMALAPQRLEGVALGGALRVPADLAEAIFRNVYGARQDAQDNAANLSRYVLQNIEGGAGLVQQDGVVLFIDPDPDTINS